MICPACCTRPILRGALCGPCTVATQITPLGINEGRDYEAQPHMVHGIVTYYEVYEQSRDGRRFHGTMKEWPTSAAARRIGPVAVPDGLRDGEGTKR